MHTYEDGSLGGVIGILFDRTFGGNTSNSLLTQVNAGTVTTAGSARAVSFKSWMDTQDLTDFYSYDGSLTTPPCTEGIKWSVLQTVQPITDAQLAGFTSKWAGS